MKKIINLSLVLLAIVIVGFSCKKWTEPEALDHRVHKSDEYYENLRAYKKSDHQVSFGWFGNWTGKGASLTGSLAGLPDSIDFVSIWGNWKGISEEQKADLKMFQEKKGSKALVCFIVDNLGIQLTPPGLSDAEFRAFWGWTNGDPLIPNDEAIVNYANAICDSIDKYGYDGFDIDYEPNYGHSGNLSGKIPQMTVFINTLAKRLGPLSGTDKMLVLDGEPQTSPPSTAACFNYFIVQAYNSYGPGDLQNRINQTFSNFNSYPGTFTSKMYIVTENYEKYAATGGANFTQADGTVVPSLIGMAGWNPTQGSKGGVGTFHMEYEYSNQPEYKYLREAIQIMNPGVQ